MIVYILPGICMLNLEVDPACGYPINGYSTDDADMDDGYEYAQ